MDRMGKPKAKSQWRNDRQGEDGASQPREVFFAEVEVDRKQVGLSTER